MRLQKDNIVKVALEVLDRDGLEGVTLRRLAKELGVQAPAIYWHIPSKEALLDEMANAILEEYFRGFDFENDQRDWAEWLRRLAHDLRAAMLAHREGARVVAGAHLGIAVMLTRLFDLSIRILHNAGFSASKPATITVTVIHFTFGSVIEEQASPPLHPAPVQPLEMFVPLERFPTFAAVMRAFMSEDNDMHFDTSVRMIINGARAELDSQSRAAD